MNRFVRTELLLGRQALDKLRRAHVVVVGLGAVGSYALEGLVRAGVGRLRLVDADVIRPSNFNRQLLALESTLGRSKVEVARERALAINPDCQVEALALFADARSVAQVVAGAPDVLIDAIDSVGPKVELLTAAVRAGIPTIASFGAATRTDPAAIRVGDLAETEICPLARWVRKRLKRRGITGGIRCIYSLEPPRSLPETAAVTDGGEDEAPLRGRRRRPLGSLSCVTGIFGLLAAREALDLLVGLSAPVDSAARVRERNAT